MKKGKQRFCAICAHDIKDVKCPHPWHLPFEQWPKPELEKLRAMVPVERTAGS